MSNGGPPGLHGSDYRYIRRPSSWTVDDERARTRIHWLVIAVIFSLAFSALFIFVTLTYAVELWIFLTGLILLLFALVCSYAILHLRSKPSTGAYYKRFKLRPASVVGLLERAARSSGIELKEVPVRTTSLDMKRYWDTFRSYEIAGRQSHVNVIRRFWVFFFWVNQYTYVEMGPKGMGEDGFLDDFAAATDAAADLVGEEPTRVDFSGARGEYSKATAILAISEVLWFVVLVQLIGNRWGWYEPGTSGPIPVDHLTLFLIIAANFALGAWGQRMLLTGARKVTSEGTYEVATGPS